MYLNNNNNNYTYIIYIIHILSILSIYISYLKGRGKKEVMVEEGVGRDGTAGTGGTAFENNLTYGKKKWKKKIEI